MIRLRVKREEIRNLTPAEHILLHTTKSLLLFLSFFLSFFLSDLALLLFLLRLSLA